jgi:hypothetical protein
MSCTTSISKTCLRRKTKKWLRHKMRERERERDCRRPLIIYSFFCFKPFIYSTSLFLKNNDSMPPKYTTFHHLTYVAR